MCNKQPIESSILTEYIDFLRNYQCLSEVTINIRKLVVKPFLLKLGVIDQQSILRLISASTIYNYIITTAQPLRSGSKKLLSSSIRSFLRFAHIKGYLTRDLVEAVPVITTWKLDRLPQGISWKNAQKLLTLPDKNTSGGRRDLAVLSLLVHYGVRIGQVTALKLQDINWQNEIISFAACKSGNSLQLPLHKDVAEALLSYIKNDRCKSQCQELFLTLREPQHPLYAHSNYYGSIKKYYIKAGITSSSQGSCNIRHAFATELVKQKVPMKAISDLLGHRCIDSTFIYTKVDVTQLRTLAREWPEGGEK